MAKLRENERGKVVPCSLPNVGRKVNLRLFYKISFSFDTMHCLLDPINTGFTTVTPLNKA